MAPLFLQLLFHYVDQMDLGEPIGTMHAPCSSCFWKQLPLYRPWHSQAFSSSRLKNPEYQNISNQSIFPPLLIIKILLYDMVPQAEEMLAVIPVTGRKIAESLPGWPASVFLLPHSYKGHRGFLCAVKMTLLTLCNMEESEKKKNKKKLCEISKYQVIS